MKLSVVIPNASESAISGIRKIPQQRGSRANRMCEVKFQLKDSGIGGHAKHERDSDCSSSQVI